MSDDQVKAKRIRILQALFAKTEDNGCTEEEANNAQEQAMRLMGEWAIEDWDLDQKSDKPKLMLRKKLNVKYANGWRVRLCGRIATNTGVFCTYFGKDLIEFWGPEHTVELAATIAEHMVKIVEDMSKAYARATGTGTKGRRDYAEGCGLRVGARIGAEMNMTFDKRLPAIVAKNSEESERWMLESTGQKKLGKGRVGTKRSERTESFHVGYEDGNKVDIHGATRTRQVT